MRSVIDALERSVDLGDQSGQVRSGADAVGDVPKATATIEQGFVSGREPAPSGAMDASEERLRVRSLRRAAPSLAPALSQSIF